MKKAITLAALLALPALPIAASAQDSSAAFKLSAYSEYEYRGISQTSEKPAAQFNADWSLASGIYAGAFVSNISWLRDTAIASGSTTKARIELDLFAGFKKEIAAGVTADLGVLRYQYPSSSGFSPSPNTTEIYAGLSHGALSAKVSRSVTPLFGFAGSKGSTFTELNWSSEIAKGLTLNAQIARQTIRNNGAFSYNVYKAGLTWDLGDGWTAGGYAKGTNANADLYTIRGRDWSDNRVVVFVSKSF